MYVYVCTYSNDTDGYCPAPDRASVWPGGDTVYSVVSFFSHCMLSYINSGMPHPQSAKLAWIAYSHGVQSGYIRGFSPWLLINDYPLRKCVLLTLDSFPRDVFPAGSRSIRR